MATLTALPLELQAHVLAHADDFSTLLALVLSSRSLYEAWLVHRRHIERSILARCIPALPEATRLVDSQLEYYQEPRSTRAKRFIANQRLANKMTQIYIENVVYTAYAARHDGPYLTPSEISRLHRTFYRYWQLYYVAALQNSSSDSRAALKAALAHYGLPQMQRIREIEDWFAELGSRKLGEKVQRDIVLPEEGRFWTRRKFPSLRQMFFDELYERYYRVRKQVKGEWILTPKGAASYGWAMYDEYQDYLHSL